MYKYIFIYVVVFFYKSGYIFDVQGYGTFYCGIHEAICTKQLQCIDIVCKLFYIQNIPSAFCFLATIM